MLVDKITAFFVYCPIETINHKLNHTELQHTNFDHNVWYWSEVDSDLLVLLFAFVLLLFVCLITLFCGILIFHIRTKILISTYF